MFFTYQRELCVLRLLDKPLPSRPAGPSPLMTRGSLFAWSASIRRATPLLSFSDCAGGTAASELRAKPRILQTRDIPPAISKLRRSTFILGALCSLTTNTLAYESGFISPELFCSAYSASLKSRTDRTLSCERSHERERGASAPPDSIPYKSHVAESYSIRFEWKTCPSCVMSS